MMSAFRIRTAGFALRPRSVAGRTFTAGCFTALWIRRSIARSTFGTCAFTATFNARGTLRACDITGLFPIARTLRIFGTLPIARALRVGAALTIPRSACLFPCSAISRRHDAVAAKFGALFGVLAGRAIGRTIKFAPCVAIARSKGACAEFAVAWPARRRTEAISISRITLLASRSETFARSAFAPGIRRRDKAAGACTFTRRTRRRARGQAVRRRRHQLVHREFAVVVFVERAQGFRCADDFVLGDDSVAILVEGGDDGRDRRMFPATRSTGRPIGLRATFAGRRGRGTALRWLSIRKARWQGERERDDDCLGFHGLDLVWLFVLLLLGTRMPGQRACEKSLRRMAGARASLEKVTLLSLRLCV